MKAKEIKKDIKKHKLLLEQVSKLRELKLPPKWEVAKLDVVFKRVSGEDMYKDAQVVYDSRNDTFYVQTSKSIVYESEKEPMLEAIEVMEKANRIIKR